MMWTAAAIAFLLLIGPLRRHWRFVLPATVGAIVGLALARLVVSAGGPAFVLVLAPALFGIQLGAAGKAWLDKLGPPQPGRR